MSAVGLLLWGVALLLLIGAVVGVILWPGAGDGPAARWESTYLILSWATLPLVLPVVLHRLLPPPGPEIPAALTALALIRTFLGVLLALVGVGLVLWLASRARAPWWVGITALANLVPFAILAWPRT